MQSSTSPFSKVRGKQVGDPVKSMDQMLIYSLAAADNAPQLASKQSQSGDSNSNSGIQTPTFKHDSSSGFQTPPVTEIKTEAKQTEKPGS